MTTDKPNEHVLLEQAVPGKEVTHANQGSHYFVDARAETVEDAESLDATFDQMLAAPGSNLCKQLAHTCKMRNLLPTDFIFMDIETTGLRRTPLFLIGVMVWDNGGFEVRQFFARDYPEEGAVIASFIEACSNKRLLVTFNGKSFDLPFIQARAAVSRLPFDLDLAHLDLLHVGRRVWGRSLPNCKLQTLERFVCARTRIGDLPGSQIPDAYHEYVRTRNAWQIVDILKHNVLDLVTLADLMTRFPDQ